MKEYWITRNGDKIDVDTMDITHLRNCLKMVIRNINIQKQEKEKQLIHLHGEIAQQMYEQMIEEEYASDSDFEVFMGEL